MATLVGAIGCRIHRLPVKTFADCTAVAGAVGQALGRIGCFLVGDDYGRPSSLPWAVAFPQGAPPTLERVHPTQLYEVAWLLPVAALLWSRRRKSPFLFGEYLVANGLGRIAIESWRVNPKVALGLTEPQWIGLGLIVAGASGWLLLPAARSAGRRRRRVSSRRGVAELRRRAQAGDRLQQPSGLRDDAGAVFALREHPQLGDHRVRQTGQRRVVARGRLQPLRETRDARRIVAREVGGHAARVRRETVDFAAPSPPPARAPSNAASASAK